MKQQDQNLWGLFRRANGIWDDVERSPSPIENIEHYLWDAQPEFPSSERSLLFSNLYSFLIPNSKMNGQKECGDKKMDIELRSAQ